MYEETIFKINIFDDLQIQDEFYCQEQGVKLTFFSDSHLAPKFFKVVAN